MTKLDISLDIDPDTVDEDIPDDYPIDFVVSGRQLLLLSRNFKAEQKWPVHIGIAEVVATSSKWSLPVNQIMELAQPLIEIGVALDLDPARIADDFIASERQLQLMSWNLDGEPPWLAQLDIVQVLNASRNWSLSVRQVVDLALPLLEIGVASDFDPATIPVDFIVSERLFRLRPRRSRRRWGGRDKLTLKGVLQTSHFLSLPVRQVAELARPLLEIGFTIDFKIEAIPDDYRISEQQFQLLSITDDWIETRADNLLNLAVILRASHRWSMSVSDVAELAQPLLEFGLAFNFDPNALPVDFVASDRLVQLLSRDIDGEAPWVGQLDIGQFLKASHKWSLPIRQVMDIAGPILDMAEFALYRNAMREMSKINEPFKDIGECLYEENCDPLSIAMGAFFKKLPVESLGDYVEMLGSVPIRL